MFNRVRFLSSALASLAFACSDGDPVNIEQDSRSSSLQEAADAGASLSAVDDGNAAVDAGMRGAPEVQPPSIPNPDQLLIEAVTASGPGCPPGSAMALISPDGRDVNVRLTSMKLEARPDDVLKNQSLECIVTVRVKVPIGTSYEVNGYSLRGTAALEEGMTAEVSRRHSIQGSSSASPVRVESLAGPRNSGFALDDTLAESERLSAPCTSQRSVQVRLRLSLLNGTPAGSGVLRLDELGPVKLGLRECQG